MNNDREERRRLDKLLSYLNEENRLLMEMMADGKNKKKVVECRRCLDDNKKIRRRNFIHFSQPATEERREEDYINWQLKMFYCQQ